MDSLRSPLRRRAHGALRHPGRRQPIRTSDRGHPHHGRRSRRRRQRHQLGRRGRRQRHAPASLLRRPHSPHHPRRRRNGRRGRPDDPGDSLLAAGRASLSRQPMPVPPLPAHPVAPRPPHPTLGRWRTHRPGQLGTSVPTPPPPAPRGPMACRRQPERDPHLSRIRRAPLQQRTRHPTRRRPRYSGPAGPAGPAAERTGSDAPEDDRGSGPAIQPGHRRDVVVGPGAGRVEISLADRGCHRQLGRRRSRQ